MIKVNLLPLKKKKKAKPIPTFLITALFITVAVIFIDLYLVYMYESKRNDRVKKVHENETKIKELEARIKAVEEYEKRNAVFNQRKEIIEKLGKNKSLPVKILDEISTLLPAGVWLRKMTLADSSLITLECTAFSVTDASNFIQNLKNSKIFAEVDSKETTRSQSGNISTYGFTVTFKVKE